MKSTQQNLLALPHGARLLRSKRKCAAFR